jgi:hypothetical protein
MEELQTIKGHCTTNLDDYRMTVKEFYRVPNIGERVSCLYKGNEASLKVCQITHDFRNNEPYIIVELHKQC